MRAHVIMELGSRPLYLRCGVRSQVTSDTAAVWVAACPETWVWITHYEKDVAASERLMEHGLSCAPCECQALSPNERKVCVGKTLKTYSEIRKSEQQDSRHVILSGVGLLLFLG